MRRKEQIIEVLKKHIGECAISGDDADYLLFHLTKDILSLPIDVPSEEEIEEWVKLQKPIQATYYDAYRYAIQWAINGIIERNKR